MSDPASSDWQSPGGPTGRPRYGEYAAPGQLPPPPLGDAPSGGGAAWAPPPKPGIVPLRPLAFGALLGAPFQLLRRSGGILGLAFLLQFVVLLVGGGVVSAIVFAGFARITDWNDPHQAPLIAGAIASSILGGLALMVLNFVVSALLQGIVVVAAARATLGERPTLRAAWPHVKPRVRRLIAWTALLGLALLLVFALLAGVVVLGIALGPIGTVVAVSVAVLLGLAAFALWLWLYTKLSTVPSILVLEHAPIRAAMRRSWRLTDGFFWRTFGAEILVAVIIWLAVQIISTPVSLLLPLVGALIDPNQTGAGAAITVLTGIVGAAIGLLGGAVSSFVSSALVALIYIDLRMRKEGLDLVLQRHVEGGDPAADPFAVGAA